MAERPDPFQLAFGPLVPERFEAVRLGLAAEDVDWFDRDAFVLSRPAVELLRELRPEEGLGEGIDELVAVTHAAFVFWQQGERVVTLERAALDGLLREPPPAPPAGGRMAYYAELPPRRVWGEPVPGAGPEPLEGWFAVAEAGVLTLAAVFGLLPGRPGFSVVQAAGAAPGPLWREDGSPAFAPVLAGGEAAGLWSVVGGEELLDLGWRVHRRVLATGGPPPGRSEVHP